MRCKTRRPQLSDVHVRSTSVHEAMQGPGDTDQTKEMKRLTQTLVVKLATGSVLHMCVPAWLQRPTAVGWIHFPFCLRPKPEYPSRCQNLTD